MKIGWRGALGFVLSAAFLLWTMREVSFAQVWGVLRQSSLPRFRLSATGPTLIVQLRAVSGRVILEPIDHDIPFGALWRSTAVGMMVNNVFPARAGELARAYALTREEPRVNFAAAFASLAVDRIFDAVTVVILLVTAMIFSDFPPETTIGGQPINRVAMGTGLLAVGALAGVVAMAMFPSLVVRIWDGVVGRIAPRFVDRGRRLLESFMSGLGALRSPVRFAKVLGWAIVTWLVNGLSFWIGFLAVGIEAPYTAALFLMGVIAISVALRSSHGFFGVFEAAALAGLTLYNVKSDLAVSWALGFHLLAFLPITLIGLFYFARLGMKFGELGQQAAGGTTKAGAPA